MSRKRINAMAYQYQHNTAPINLCDPLIQRELGIGFNEGAYYAADGQQIPGNPFTWTAEMYAGLRYIKNNVDQNRLRDTRALEKNFAAARQSMANAAQQREVHSLAVPARGFRIEEFGDRYRIQGVNPIYGPYADVSRNLLENGAKHTQQGWTELTQYADWQKKNGIWQLGSAPLQTAVFTALYNNQNHSITQQKDLVEKVRQMLMNDFNAYWMTTSTRIEYKAEGKDAVIHDWNYPNQRIIEENIVGPDGNINAGCGFGNALNALCGINNPALAEQAYEYISGVKPYLCRINSKSAQDIERVLVLVAGSIRFYIDAVGDIGDNRPARGWSASCAKKSV